MQAGFPRDKGTDSNNEVSVVKAVSAKQGSTEGIWYLIVKSN